MTHTLRKSHGLGSLVAITPGVRRMPEPIVLPMMTAKPKATPSSRSREPRCTSPLGEAEETSACEGTLVAMLSHSQISRRFQRRAADAADDRRAIAASQWIAHWTSALGTIQFASLFGLSHGERSL